MKTSPVYRALSIFVILAGATPAGAQDYQCRDTAGCVATIYQDGAARRVNFRKGDLVTTAAGWVVDPKDGWIRIPTAEDRTKQDTNAGSVQ